MGLRRRRAARAIAAVVGLVVIVALARTVAVSSKQPPATPLVDGPIDADAVAGRLAEAEA